MSARSEQQVPRLDVAVDLLVAVQVDEALQRLEEGRVVVEREAVGLLERSVAPSASVFVRSLSEPLQHGVIAGRPPAAAGSESSRASVSVCSEAYRLEAPPAVQRAAAPATAPAPAMGAVGLAAAGSS